MLKRFSGIIYMYKSPSGKYYIGQTTRPKFRKNEHVSRAFNGSELPFHRAIRKYGIDSFEYSILCRVKHLREGFIKADPVFKYLLQEK